MRFVIANVLLFVLSLVVLRARLEWMEARGDEAESASSRSCCWWGEETINIA